MCMQVDRNLYRLFQCLYKLCSLCRNKQTSHIFDTDRTCSHILNSLRCLYPVIQCISITKCIRKSYLRLCFFLICCIYCCLICIFIFQNCFSAFQCCFQSCNVFIIFRMCQDLFCFFYCNFQMKFLYAIL